MPPGNKRKKFLRFMNKLVKLGEDISDDSDGESGSSTEDNSTPDIDTVSNSSLSTLGRYSSSSTQDGAPENYLQHQTIPSSYDSDVASQLNMEQKARENWGKLRKHSDQLIAKHRVVRIMQDEPKELSPQIAAWFLGPKAENLDMLKNLVIHALDEHAEFRRYKYFPLDPEYIDKDIMRKPAFRKAERKIKAELDILSERLKNSIPFFNFRSQGHMLWDTTIASNVGYIAAILYNQNNVASMASGVTLQLEREVVSELCRMVGYNLGEHSIKNPKSWGHLPNGGTVANIEAMWAARCLKYNGLAIQKMMKINFNTTHLSAVRDSFMFRKLDGKKKLLKDGTPWELLNIPIDEAIDMYDNLLQTINTPEPIMEYDELFSLVQECTMEEQGVLEFFENIREEYPNPRMGRWFVPGSRHYSWDKGNNILGMGRQNLIKVTVDADCRMDLITLRENLQECREMRIPVIGVTAVFGTTQEGAVDDLVEILKIRDEFERMENGLTFYIHVDGAWGGYFASTMWNTSDQENELKPDFEPPTVSNMDTTTFPACRISRHFESQLRAIRYANSITLDPHKTGFCPYPAGGLLYRNGNIKKFLAQNAAYVNHGSKNNEEINLCGIDGSKPGAASAAVWLSHRVIGLDDNGYGLLLRQCTFSAAVMYAMWVSMERPEDPFTIVPAVPLVKTVQGVKWTRKMIRKEILKSENQVLLQNQKAMTFLIRNGPDTLINCISANFRVWDNASESWKLNDDPSKQIQFIDSFYKRCSHSIEKPSMVDRGIQVIMNSTTWDPSSHGKAYTCVKKTLGLRGESENKNENKKIKMLINTCMSPWLRAQKTFERISVIIRNEFYNAVGAVTDPPENLSFVSPCSIETYKDWVQDGFLFGELEASFCKERQSKNYHVIGLFCVRNEDRAELIKLAKKAQNLAKDKPNVAYLPLRFQIVKKITVFDLMTGLKDEPTKPEEGDDDVDGRNEKRKLGERKSTMSECLEKYSDQNQCYSSIPQQEIEVNFFYSHNLSITGNIKLRRVIRYHHLARDFVDETDYPPTQEYILYSYQQFAYLSHCPNRYPDFQQLIELDKLPTPVQARKNYCELYEEALSRGVIVYLPQIEVGGRPLLRKDCENVCRDPLFQHTYNAVSWSDQGAFTGDMISINLQFINQGKRWFDGSSINEGYNKSQFPMYFTKDGKRKEYPEEEEDEPEDDIYSLPSIQDDEIEHEV